MVRTATCACKQEVRHTKRHCDYNKPWGACAKTELHALWILVDTSLYPLGSHLLTPVRSRLKHGSGSRSQSAAGGGQRRPAPPEYFTLPRLILGVKFGKFVVNSERSIAPAGRAGPGPGPGPRPASRAELGPGPSHARAGPGGRTRGPIKLKSFTRELAQEVDSMASAPKRVCCVIFGPKTR